MKKNKNGGGGVEKTSFIVSDFFYILLRPPVRLKCVRIYRRLRGKNWKKKTSKEEQSGTRILFYKNIIVHAVTYIRMKPDSDGQWSV